MPYKDMCVSVVDKVQGSFRTGAEMPARSVERDAIRYVYKDIDDAVAVLYEGMPDKLDLWDEVTCAECFFNPQVQGFTYAEPYNPEYWMEIRVIPTQSCFHPLYRMRSRNTTSVVDRTTAAFLITRYSDIEPIVESGVSVAANSFFFGFPLWFFDHASVDSIADVIFDEWQILGEQ